VNQLHAEHVGHAVGAQRLIGTAGGHQGATVQNPDPVSERRHQAQLVQRGHHGNAEPAHQGQKVGAGREVKVVGGLVQQQQYGLLRQCACQVRTLALATRQAGQRPVRQGAEPAGVQGLVYRLRVFRAASAVLVGQPPQGDVVVPCSVRPARCWWGSRPRAT